METGQEMADFIVSQMSVPVPVVTVDATRQFEVGVSVEKWTATSGTPLMYNGQGKYEGEQPDDRMEHRVENQREVGRKCYRVGGGSRSGAEQLLQEPTT